MCLGKGPVQPELRSFQPNSSDQVFGSSTAVVIVMGRTQMLKILMVISAAVGLTSYMPWNCRCLQNSMAGPGARIAIVCNITPAAAQAEETANTLKFATRAKLVRWRRCHGKQGSVGGRAKGGKHRAHSGKTRARSD